MNPGFCCVQEAGYNALHFNQLANSWVRNVGFINTDAGFYCWCVVGPKQLLGSPIKPLRACCAAGWCFEGGGG
jgi:hypothetical protein